MSDKIKVIAKERLFVQDTGEYVEVGEAVELDKAKVEILLPRGAVEIATVSASQKQKGADAQSVKE